jgi:hypothetical protein
MEGGRDLIFSGVGREATWLLQLSPLQTPLFAKGLASPDRLRAWANHAVFHSTIPLTFRFQKLRAVKARKSRLPYHTSTGIS